MKNINKITMRVTMEGQNVTVLIIPFKQRQVFHFVCDWVQPTGRSSLILFKEMSGVENHI